MNEMLLYDLAGADDAARWSPFCWRAKLALAHKGLAFTAVPWHYFEKEALAPSQQGEVPRVPVLVDRGEWINDSWRIALYLEERYPERPPLFGGTASREHTLFVKHWLDADVHPHLVHITVLDMYRRLHPRDQPYFRASREQRFGMTLEEFGADQPRHVAALRQALEPVRRTLADQPFLGGDAPLFADHLVAGALLWGANACEQELLAADDPVLRWRDDLIARYERSLRA
jgi:glutathione S-transferase